MACQPALCCPSARPSAAPPARGGPDARETVLLLHGSAGSGALWRRAAELLPPRYRAEAPDLLGYGGATLPPESMAGFDLSAEVQALAPRLPRGTEAFHVVGYSYGGIVALHLALAMPDRVRTLTLIEPVFFRALLYAGERDAHDRFAEVRDRFAATLARGDAATAMRAFVDFWAGDGAWAALPQKARAAMQATAGKILLDWQASFDWDPGPARLAALGRRTTLLVGARSPAPMRALVDALHGMMPGSRLQQVPGAGHLLPLTHADAAFGSIVARLGTPAGGPPGPH